MMDNPNQNFTRFDVVLFATILILSIAGFIVYLFKILDHG